MTPDPYAPHLRKADELFAQGEIVKAGQIWQAVLKQNPSHGEARAGLMAVKQRLLAQRAAAETGPPPLPEPPAAQAPGPEACQPESATVTTAEPEPVLPPVADPRATAPEAPPPVDPGRVITGTLSPDRLLAEGCTLYDMGQLGDALKKWEQVLALDPDHALARGYANGARRELGLPLLQAPVAPAAPQAESLPAEEDIDKLLREAVQLYDMGLVEEAISKWERVLVLEPQRQEIANYLRQARAELTSSSQPYLPTGPIERDSEALDLKLRQAEHLLGLQRREEAAFTFQQALGLDPGNARALQGLERCRQPSGRPAPAAEPQHQASLVTLDAQGRIAMAREELPTSLDAQGVEPPAALLKTSTAPREGLSLPDRFRHAAEAMPWLKNPRHLAGAVGGVLILLVVLGMVHSYHKDQALKEEVSAARAAAVAPLAHQAQAPELAEASSAIRQEAEIALSTDPLRAYLRAEILVARNPGDAAAAQLLEKARAGLAGGVTGASLPEFQKHLQNGDLEAAGKVIDTLLRAQPDDADLRTRAAHLNLTLCFAHASQGKWDEAQEDLVRGRALFPEDKTWQARLKLLEYVKTMPKEQRPAWISLLG